MKNMKSDKRNKKKLFIRTFGCQMNVYDSETLADLFFLRNILLTDNMGEADIVFVNTCSVREKAEQKACSFIGRLQRFKLKKPNLIVAVGGCMGQRMGETLLERFPFVDIVVGTDTFYYLPELVERYRTSGKKLVQLEFSREFPRLPLVKECVSGQVTAMVTIMQGCDNFCTYCIVPYVRGREKSRPSSDIVREIQELTSKGVKEVTLLGQNVNSYGLKDGDITFPELLRLIARETDLLRLRFTTSHPKDLSEDLMKCFHDLEILCKHIHLPVQAGSNKILRLMNRRYTREEYLQKVRKLREYCPEIAISTDVMVGFPGEEEADYLDTLRLLEEVRFDTVFSFKYSDRPGTAAASFRGKVPEKVKTRRLIQLQELQNKITLEQNEKLVGTVQEVLVAGTSKADERQLTGRTGDNHIVNFYGPRNLIGELVPVTIVEAYAHSLKGELPLVGEFSREKDQCVICR